MSFTAPGGATIYIQYIRPPICSAKEKHVNRVSSVNVLQVATFHPRGLLFFKLNCYLWPLCVQNGALHVSCFLCILHVQVILYYFSFDSTHLDVTRINLLPWAVSQIQSICCSFDNVWVLFDNPHMFRLFSPSIITFQWQNNTEKSNISQPQFLLCYFLFPLKVLDLLSFVTSLSFHSHTHSNSLFFHFSSHFFS